MTADRYLAEDDCDTMELETVSDLDLRSSFDRILNG